MRKIAVLFALVALAGCTDADQARLVNFGSPGRVTCHSGDKVVFDDFSTGRISKHGDSDGFYFVSLTTGRLTEVAGTCTVDYGVGPTAAFKAVRQ
jgi:hypothetical protein